VADCFSSTAFGLYFFCGGGYCGCVLELAPPIKLIQRGSGNDVNMVSTRDGDSSVNIASQGHCAGVFIGI
jgi:hypothetical protein